MNIENKYIPPWSTHHKTTARQKEESVLIQTVKLEEKEQGLTESVMPL